MGKLFDRQQTLLGIGHPLQWQPTGGLNWDYFTVKGWHYLLLTTNTTLPQIYRWNGADFELYRVLAMDKAFGSALFSAGPLENYLILGSLIGPQGYGTPSRVYKFD